MRLWQPRDRQGLPVFKVALTVLVLVTVSLVIPGAGGGPVHALAAKATDAVPSVSPSSLAAVEALPLTAVPDAASDAVVPGSTALATVPIGALHVLVTFAYSNSSGLTAFLAELSTRSSPDYHHYLTAQQFVAAYAPPAEPYYTASAYFASFGVKNLTSQPDRESISFDAPATTLSRIFHDGFGSFEKGGARYVAPLTAPELPGPLSAAIQSVVGLGTAPGQSAVPAALGSVQRATARSAGPVASVVPSGYTTPPTVNGTQEEYLSDMQVAYDEQSLFAQGGYPTNESIAAILWSGNYTGPTIATPCGPLTSGSAVGPWDPADVQSFFNSTLPSGEPRPVVVPVALGGAPAPTCHASWDTTGATRENTVDLESLGSTAPGAQLYDVYGPSAAPVELDAEFTDILSPPGVLGATLVQDLDNVSVIVSSWDLVNHYDATWYADLEQAQARGISVLAASGDADDSPASPYWVGSFAEFPAAMAYDTFGDVAVGGTSLTLDPSTLHLSTEAVWDVPLYATGPVGSEGGSAGTIVAEPTWQLSTSANRNLSGNGRGVPDIAAIANNSLITLSVKGYQYRATNASSGGAFEAASGTSVAVSVVAGLVAEIDHAMRSTGAAPLGFFDPALYYWANLEYTNQSCGTKVQGASCEGVYPSSLPTLLVRDVETGRNAQYPARYGFELAAGWGELDAYNFTVYTLNLSSAGVYGHLAAVQDQVNLAGLKVTSTYSASSGGGVNKVYNASFQQNVFLADSLGAPIYWIQNVVFLHRAAAGWAMNFTAWVSYPFWGIYPTLTVSEWWFPGATHVETLPLALNLTTQLVPGAGTIAPHVEYSFGVKGSIALSLSVPGASYIIGRNNYSYSWQGVNYTDGPKGNASPPGFLAPQFGLLGGPGDGIGNFLLSTNGTIGAYVEPFGDTSFELADTAALNSANHQSGETDSNLTYAPVSHGNWTFGYGPGSSEQGILQVQPARYNVVWNATGTPPAGTLWYVNLSSGPHLSATAADPQIVAELQNGSYGWTVGLSARGWASAPPTGTIVVGGRSLEVNVTVALTYGTVTFNATGPSFPFRWYVNVTGGPSLGSTNASIGANLTFGAYTYVVSTGNSSWAPTHHKGSFVIGETIARVAVPIALVTYAFKVIASYPVNVFVHWTITVGTFQKSGSITTPFTFLLPNGTYEYSVSGLPSGYTTSVTSGSVVIHGAAARLVIVVIPPPTNGLGVWSYVIVGGLVVVGLLSFLVLLRRRRRRSKKTEPPARKSRRSRKDWVDPDEL
ncbi:MAG: protease pro-enzyme activation domain-containing protein [Thermoplasmata archaeon]